MAERVPDQRKRRAVVEAVTAMRVPEPVAGHWLPDAGRLCCLAHDYPDAAAIQELSAPGGEYRILRSGRPTQVDQLRPQRRWQSDRPRPATLTVDADLAGIAVWTQVAPAEAAGFGNAKASTVEQVQKHAVARLRIHG